jgi:hypothetical protein
MPNFTDRPPTEPAGHNFDVVRCPAQGKIIACITCPELVGCPTHFYRGHTVPCEQPTCAACQEGLPWRWHGYVTIFTAKTHWHQLLELTAPPAETLAEYRDKFGTLRGCLITVNRTSPRPNGRVRLTTSTADLTKIELPQAPDLRLVLATVWNLPELAAEIRGQLKRHREFIATNPDPLPPDRGTSRLADILPAAGNGRCS